MTSAPQMNVPLGGDPTYMITNLRNSVFQRATGLLDASGAPIIKSSLRSTHQSRQRVDQLKYEARQARDIASKCMSAHQESCLLCRAGSVDHPALGQGPAA
jgi:hypothetical protein